MVQTAGGGKTVAAAYAEQEPAMKAAAWSVGEHFAAAAAETAVLAPGLTLAAAAALSWAVKAQEWAPAGCLGMNASVQYCLA